MHEYKSFLLLNAIERVEMLMKYGIFLAERRDKNHRQHLFQLNDCYIEVWYQSEAPEIYFYMFSSQADLEPWLEEIDISDIFQH